MGKLLAWPLLGLVWLYRNAISPLLGMNCRFEPTCSAYAIEALHRYGGFKGGWLMLKRLSRCHPWGGSGYDPVPILPIIYPERTVGTEHSSVPGSEPIVKDQRKLGTKTRSVPGSEPGSDPKVLSESTIGSDPIIDSEKTSGSEQDSDPRAG